MGLKVVDRSADSKSVLVISGQDARSRRRVNVHFIAEELAKLLEVRWFSVGFSTIGNVFRTDPRSDLRGRVNRVEHFRAIECYLWGSIIHPFNSKGLLPAAVERAIFGIYRRRVPDIFEQWVLSADYIIVESGLGVLFAETARILNPKAKIVYLASDALDTIGCSDFLVERLAAATPHFDWIKCPSRLIAGLPHNVPVDIVPHGIDLTSLLHPQPSPYRPNEVTAVSVGSMLFDSSFFRHAAAAFPNISFVIIGAGRQVEGLTADNIVVLQEMPYESTLKYIQHASIGLAPYREAGAPAYLADTSMKIRQYEAIGLPIVCPHFAVSSGSTGRFGYTVDDAASIMNAIDRALQAGRQVPRHDIPTWHDVAKATLRLV